MVISSWKPASKGALAFGVLAAIAFWIHSFTNKDDFLLIERTYMGDVVSEMSLSSSVAKAIARMEIRE